MHVFDLSITYHQKIMTCPDTMLAVTYYLLNGPDGRCFLAAWAVSKSVH